MNRADLLKDKQQIEAFISKRNASNTSDRIPPDYFNNLTESHSGGVFLERISRFGDPSVFEMPIPAKMDSTANMTFAGLQTFVRFSFYDKPPPGERRSLYLRNPKSLTFEQLVNLSCSA